MSNIGSFKRVGNDYIGQSRYLRAAATTKSTGLAAATRNEDAPKHRIYGRQRKRL
ncbi:hypothetical protein [Asticcacaulis endophyticus]|uniref:Uncharacterized protein n=1 Tax=Asticcacaulis endophyticus TaxID=1395890 RepID=A0A918UTE3_9CAUL|nr:hypothetical protein [Asticcacaulis endophyticus]GGZ32618.1 hypothetical protein GCM10011273_18490 [Asticcacaulis endophyticus]